MSVALGLPGPWANDKFEASDHYTSKIGGVPDFPFPRSSLRPDFHKCGKCDSGLCLVAQVLAPVSFPTHKIEERVLYIFGCTSPLCGSWRALRVQKSHACRNSNNEVAPALGSNTKWWDDIYSFGSGRDEDLYDDDDIELDDLGKALSEAGALASSSKKQNVKKQCDSATKPLASSSFIDEILNDTLVLPCFYIYLENEAPKDLTSICSSISSLSVKTSQETNQSKDPEENYLPEAYEHDRARTADRTSLKFQKRIDAYPEQCFRYAYNGKPLLAMAETEDPGTCRLCGGSRHYEMQLMTPLLHFLEEFSSDREKDLLESWMWITLVVYTCSQSCYKKAEQEVPDLDGWIVAEEAVIAQVE